MELRNTEDWLKQALADAKFDSYAIFVHKNGDEAFLHSENVNEDTYFDIASLGKILITTPLILKAVTEKMLSLEDTLDRFFDNVPPEKKDITIQQLLTHTSGIIRIPILPKAVEKGHDAIAAQMLNHPLAFEPGTNYIYSCNGMILLGFVLEKIYNAPLESIYETKLKKPLGQTRSRFNIAVNEPNAVLILNSF